MSTRRLTDRGAKHREAASSLPGAGHDLQLDRAAGARTHNVARFADATDIPAVVALHTDRIPGFLGSLGPRFLRRLYARILRSPRAFVLVTDNSRGTSGFVAVAEDTGRLYREFLVRDGFAAALAAAPSVLRRPGRVWETLRYGTGGDHADLPPAEVLAVAVARDHQSNGVGSALVGAALDELRRRGVAAARVVTAVGNGGALRMYERAGFRRRRGTEVHAGEPQEVLVWD